ncbi:MAG TPA: glutathione peroxidase [Chryseosolibacter sp.]|nr:glutathione peroxidase [Chryseosolibacter sp.]
MLLHSVVSGLKKFFQGNPEPLRKSVFDIPLKTLQGQDTSLARYKGKKLLVVNTASKCGYTYQFEALQKLHEAYGDRVQVLGFPSNDFFQDSKSNGTIAEFCSINYGVTFPMFEKISVTGRNAHPLYRILFTQAGKTPRWNFYKYLLDENGNVIDYFSAKVDPLDKRITGKL